MINEKKGISCALFRTTEAALRDIKEKLNRAKRVEKAHFAERLREEVNALLSCPGYDQADLRCSSCRFIASAHKRTAELILKVAKIGERRI